MLRDQRYSKQTMNRRTNVLIVTRKIGQGVVIGNDIIVKVDKLKGHGVRLSIHAPKDLVVLRDELVKDEQTLALCKQLNERKPKNEDR